MRIAVVAVALFFWTPHYTLALSDDQQAEAEAARPITIDDLLAMKRVSSPKLSPDGEWIAYLVRTIDEAEDRSRSRLFMVPTAGGDPIPLTGEDYSAGSPAWSPDGRYISFTASIGDDAKSQVWTLFREGGAPVQQTHVEQGVSGYAWSPDGSRLALLIRDPEDEEPEAADDGGGEDGTDGSNRKDGPKPHVIDRIQFKRDYRGYLDRRRTQLYVMDLGSEEDPVQLTEGDYDVSSPVWSPDGSRIAFVSDRSSEPDLSPGNDIFLVASSGEDRTLRQLTEQPGQDRDAAWSPDGKTIAYVTSGLPDAGGSPLTPTRHLATVDVESGDSRFLTANLDRSVSDPVYSANGRQIYFRLEDSRVGHLAQIGASGGPVDRVIDGELVVSDMDLEGGHIAALISDDGAPGEVFLFEDGALTQLTHENTTLMADIAPPTIKAVSWASADGTTIEGIRVTPGGWVRQDGPLPTILWLHGGPASQFRHAFNGTANLFAANGYAVLMPNPRGSTGYGEAFTKATARAWGEKDVEDVIAGIDHLVAEGITDADRLGVGGWSYGGILTNYVITQTDRFKAAVSGASIGLFTAMYGHDQYQLAYEQEFGLPWEERETWERLSPFNRVDQITTATLWMGGAEDWNVPIQNSEQMYLAMKRLGRETQLVVYPGEHHGIRRPTFQRDRYERWLAWYDSHLKDDTAADIAARDGDTAGE